MRDLSVRATAKTASLLALVLALPVSAYAQSAINVSTELAQKVDSKNAKVGDEVAVRTTAPIQLADGTKLPKGTRLVAKVTEVQAKAGAHPDGHLAFLFDHAAVKDGPDVPIHATVISVSAPALPSFDGTSNGQIAGGLGGGMTPEGGRVGQGAGGSGGTPVPGLAVSSSDSAGSVLDEKGKNVELNSGTLLVLTVSAKM